MKKLLLNVFSLLLIVSLGSKSFAQSAGFNTSYAVLSINGAANTYYDLQASTGNPDFQGSNLGSFNATNSLTLKGAEHNVYKCGGCDLSSTRIYYRVYLTGTTPGAFSNLNIGYGSGGANGCGGEDQQWVNTGYTTNVLSGLAAGNYTFEVYSDASISCSGGTAFANNGGANYKSTFTYCGPTSGALPVGNYAIPGCFATVASAVTYINTNGVTGTGTVQFDVAAGYTETAPAGGFSITATGTATTAIVFKKSGAGANPTFTANSTLTAGSFTDAIYKIIGGDFITIDGFTMLENGNTTTTAASNNMTEFGVALFYATATNGCQNVTIKNCTIDLNRIYQNSIGIYANSTHTATASITSATATSATGGNHNLTITGNTITDVNQGIVVVGPTAAADMNNNLVIGGVGNANTITNYGTTGTFSGYANVSGTVNGILVRNTLNATVSNNTITSSVGGVTVGTLNGIQIPAASNTPAGTFTVNVNSNSISLKSGVITGAMNGINIPSGSATTTSVLNINANDFNNFGHTVASSGTITFITNASTHLTTSISNNTFTNLSVNTTGSVTFISNSITIPSGGTQNINSNAIVTSFNKTGAGGTVTFVTSAASSLTGSTSIWNGNNFSNITVTGATIIAGITSIDGGTVNHNITNNTVSNITGGTSAITAINSSFGGGGGGQGNVVSGNTISNISSAGAITGVSIGTSGTISSVFDNVISGLSSTGASAVQGITSGAPTSNTIYKNKIYNLQANNASGTVNGILVSAGTSHTLYNNIIGDLRTPASNAANPLVGINITGGTASNVFHNTVLLNGASSGALFGSSAVSVSSTPNVTLRNNIFINNSTFSGTGLSAAYRRSSTTLTSYNAASDNNIFYAGTPGANNVIFFDGTNSDQTLVAFKTRMATRDQASQTENVTFQSTTGSDANFLRIAAGTTTYAESGASLVTSPITINSDYWGITRPFPSPVNGGTSVDIGASEFDGIPSLVNCIAPVDQATAYVAGAVTSTTASATFTAAASVPTGYLVVSANNTPFVGTPVDGTTYAPGAALGNGAVIQSTASTTITAPLVPSNTTGNLAIYAYNSGSCAGGPKYNLVAPLTGTNTTCAGVQTLPVTNSVTSSGFTTNWTANVGGNAFPLTYSVEVTTDAAYTLPVTGSPFSTTATTLAITGLNPATNYYWRIRANNTVCDSPYLNGGLVSTDCVAITTFPSVEPFATYLPSTCWKEGDLGDLTAGPSLISAIASSWGADDYLNSNGSFVGSAKINIFSTADSDWLISPLYTIPATGYRVKYNVGATNFGATTAVTNWETDDFVQLLVSTSNANWTVLRTYNSANVPSNLGQIDESDLSAYNGQTVRFAFRAVEGATDGAADIDFFVDNFTVEVAPVAIAASASVNPICAGESTTLSVSSANTNYAYTWSPATGLSATTGASVTANPTATTTYTINAVDGGMVNVTTITVSVNPVPAVISVLPATATVCADEITPLVVAGGIISGTATIGSSTALTTATEELTAFCNRRVSFWSQTIYTAAELVAAGITAGNINSLSYNINSLGDAASNASFTIKIGTTANSNFASNTLLSTASMTTVYPATNFTHTVSGWQLLNFSTPYVWDGTSNIVVNVTHLGDDNINNAQTYYSTTANSNTNYVYDNLSAITGTLSTKRLNIRFGYDTTAPITWSPTTDLYTDAAATVNYTGTNVTTVYHKGATNTYTATATLGTCTKTATSTITVNPTVVPTFTQVAPICAGDTFTLPTSSLESVTGTWSPAINNTATTMYTFTPTPGLCSPTATMTVEIGTTKTWSGSPTPSWSPSLPTSIDAAVISADYAEAANLTACTLTVDNGSIVAIPTGTNVSLQGAITVSSGSFTLNNDANLIQANNVTNSGNIIVKRTTSPLMRQDYALWSSPVSGQLLQPFSPGTLATRFYTYDSSTDNYLLVSSPSTTNFAQATGYLIRTSNYHPAIPTVWTGTFTGVPNNGNYNVSVSSGTWNAIGNPYPSSIDADEFITANSLTDALYFWRKTNGASGTAYATYTLAGGTSGTAPNVTAPNVSGTIMTPDGTISVGQGFLAKATGSSLSFTNTMRNGVTDAQFFRTNSVDKSRVWFNLFNNEYFVNQTMVAYMPTATTGIDAAIDGRFYESNIGTQLSSLINNEEFAVQGRPTFDSTDNVSLGFKTQTAGNYTIAIDHVDGLFANGQEVYLKDNLLNVQHNLSTSAYSFASESGVFNSRFEVIYQTNLATQNPVMNENNVSIYKKDQNVVVNTGSVEMKSVQVYDIQGRLLVEKTNVNATTTKLAVSTTNQILIVKVTSNDNTVITKKVIN